MECELPVCSFSCKDRLHQLREQGRTELRNTEVLLEVIFRKIACGEEHLFSIEKQPKLQIMMLETLSYISSIPSKLPPSIFPGLRRIFERTLLSLHPEEANFSTALMVLRKVIKFFIVDHAAAPAFCSITEALMLRVVPFMLATPTQNSQRTKKQVMKLLCTVAETLVPAYLLHDYSRGKPVAKQILKLLADLIQDKELYSEGCATVPLVFKLIRKAEEQRREEVALIATLPSAESCQIIAGFNEKPEKTMIRLLESERFRSAQQVVEFMWANIGQLSKKAAGELLGSAKPSLIQTPDIFINKIGFAGQSIENGLRLLLDHFRLPGESQQIERILDSFSKAYLAQNPNSVIKDGESCYFLSYLLLMLHTNLHNPNVQDSEKMKLQYVTRMLAGKNRGEDFDPQFVQGLFNTILRTPLGFQPRQIELDIAGFLQTGNYKKLLQLYNRQNFILMNRVKHELQLVCQATPLPQQEQIGSLLVKDLGSSLSLLLERMLVPCQDKASVAACLKLYLQALGLFARHKCPEHSEKLLDSLFQALKVESLRVQAPRVKQLGITECLISASCRFGSWIGGGWNWVLTLIIRLQEYKLVEKNHKIDKQPLQNYGVRENRLWVSDAYIDGVFFRTTSLNDSGFSDLILAALTVSKKQLLDKNVQSANRLLQKCNQILDLNIERLARVWDQLWPMLGEGIVSLCESDSQKMGIFSVDCLKQVASMLFKKKPEDRFYKKNVLLSIQAIFNKSDVRLELREFILSCLLSLAGNYGKLFDEAWAQVLSVVNFGLTKGVSGGAERIANTLFSLLSTIVEQHLEEVKPYRLLLVQAIAALGKRKTDYLVKGALDFATRFLEHSQLVGEEGNQEARVTCFQAQWMPLLTMMSLVCGDDRPTLQQLATDSLFGCLNRHGGLLTQELWLLVFQGVLRPLFDQIHYTFQVRAVKDSKEEAKNMLFWMVRSCECVFQSIAGLIEKFFGCFSPFFQEVLKIYRTCICNTNQILAKLSIEAFEGLVSRVGDRLSEGEWEQVIHLLRVVVESMTPSEILSKESWQKYREQAQGVSEEREYNVKCLAQYLILKAIQLILNQHFNSLTEAQILSIQGLLEHSYKTSKTFDEDISLRSYLWKEGFNPSFGMMPGLLKQERGALASLLRLKLNKLKLFKRVSDLEQYILFSLEMLDLFILKHEAFEQGNPAAEAEEAQSEFEQNERSAWNIRCLCREQLVGQLLQLEDGQLSFRGEQLFTRIVGMLPFLQREKSIPQQEKKFEDQLRTLLLKLYRCR